MNYDQGEIVIITPTSSFASSSSFVISTYFDTLPTCVQYAVLRLAARPISDAAVNGKSAFFELRQGCRKEDGGGHHLKRPGRIYELAGAMTTLELCNLRSHLEHQKMRDT